MNGPTNTNPHNSLVRLQNEDENVNVSSFLLLMKLHKMQVTIEKAYGGRVKAYQRAINKNRRDFFGIYVDAKQELWVRAVERGNNESLKKVLINAVFFCFVCILIWH